jgi:hypothetical protein
MQILSRYGLITAAASDITRRKKWKIYCASAKRHTVLRPEKRKACLFMIFNTKDYTSRLMTRWRSISKFEEERPDSVVKRGDIAPRAYRPFWIFPCNAARGERGQRVLHMLGGNGNLPSNRSEFSTVLNNVEPPGDCYLMNITEQREKNWL